MTKLNGQSEDILKDNIAALRELFPEVCCEEKIDFDKLKQVLGEYTDDSAERYNFTWNGKGQALRLSQTPSTGTLRPCKEESKDWDDTQNLYIEGDNLEVLKLLQKSYHGKIKMIYIDPPYNTGGDFVYPDNFSDSIENYKKITGQVDDEGCKLSTNSEANGRYHTDWLNMMYPRLRLARNLLTDDGTIFISIDDVEQANLKRLCDEIFGAENFVASIIWQKVFAPKNSAKYFSVSHEYILCYAKQAGNWSPNLLERSEEANDRYKNPDQDSRGPWASDNLTARNFYGAGQYSVVCPSGRVIEGPPTGRYWTISKEKFKELDSDNRIWWGEAGDNMPRLKRFLCDVQQGIVPQTLWTFEEVGHTQEAKKELLSVVPFSNSNDVFDTPKPPRLITRMLKIATNKDSYILDFFSGSATTAQAIMQLNAEDEGNRKYLMVQLPEPCPANTGDPKCKYQTICEIGKERIRRAGGKIKAEIEEQNAQLKIGEEPKKVPDIGFKDFKLDSSNLKKWDPDFNNLEQSLFDSVGNYVDGRSELDVVYEIMLKMGLDLTWPLETHAYGGKNVYTIGLGALMICLDDHITPDVAEGMVSLHKELAPESWKVVFKDNGFAYDSAKVNIKEILKCAGLDEDAFTTV